jgi:hypothetical protein
MKQILIIILMFFTLINGMAQNAAQKMKEALSSDDYNVSLVTLIASPEKYHDKGVVVIGYLNLEFEGTAVYLHEQDFENGILKNAIWVSFSNRADMREIQKLNHSYVRIQGIFDKNQKGHMSLFGGSINEITMVESVVKRTK